MAATFFAFGEILWDCLPSGRHAGGAPFNVAAHLTQLGAPVALISSVGVDALGDEMLEVARDKGVQTQFISRARIGLLTGTVIVTIDANGNASYELVQPAAWDEIRVPEEALEAVSRARALVYGSLACRSLYNQDQLRKLLDLDGPTKFFDVNLRQPFVDPPVVMELAKRADVIKLNDDEVGRLTSWLRTGELTANTPNSAEMLQDECAVLAEVAGNKPICVTRGAAGAAVWKDGKLTCAPAPPTIVRDTVGAGDAFMAGLVMGLTRGLPLPRVIENACRLGAYVASHDGATPLFQSELIEPFRAA